MSHPPRDDARLNWRQPVLAQLQPPARRQFKTVLWITAFESFATALIEFGVYFFTEDVYGYRPVDNLLVGLAFGLLYIVGARVSHTLEQRLGARRLYRVTLLGQAVFLVALLAATIARPDEAAPVPPWAMALLNAGLALFTGLKWPVIESYVTAGMTARQASRAVGWFNLVWSVTVVLALLAAGPCIALGWRVPLIFLLSLAVAAWMAWLSRGLSPTLHSPDAPADSTVPLDPSDAARTLALVAAGRLTMLGAYTMLFLLNPLLPEILGDRLGLPVAAATAFASLLNACRVVAFGVLAFTVFWHGKAWPVVVSVALLPIGVALILLGDTLLSVAVGQVCFGIATGVTYYSALYHALVAKNASVEAGGGHEAVIGSGLALGPAIGLVGAWWMPGSAMLGMTAAAAPVLALCTAGGLWTLRVRRHASIQRPR